MDAANISYRLADPGDLAVCLALMGELVHELGPKGDTDGLRGRLPADFRAALEDDTVAILLSEVDGVAVGLARGDTLFADPTFRLQPDRRCGYVDQMYVQRAYRQRGIGQALLWRLEQWFRDQGIGAVLLHAAPAAATFYQRQNYSANSQMYKQL